MTCVHRWRLEQQRVAAAGVCLHCGAERQFTGGSAEDVMFEVVDGQLRTNHDTKPTEIWRTLHSTARSTT